tara:strand:+ start:283 stop:534 length:252 start_codon:yes stop_codon:yes gene_type:complete
MKYKYIGDSTITLKTPDPVKGQAVNLNTGDTIELDWKPGGHPQTLILVEEIEEVVVKEAPAKVTKPVTKILKAKRSSILKKKE